MNALGAALATLRRGGRRTFVTALGLLLAGSMAGAAVTVAYGLGTGFERSVQASDLPDVVARFSEIDRERIDAIVGALPNVEARAYRLDLDRVRLSANGESTRRGALQLVDERSRKGYAVVAGRDLRRGSASGEVLVERGLADTWNLEVGDELDMGRLGEYPIAGITVASDNVAFPLASAPRVSMSRQWVQRAFQTGELPVTQALIWTRDDERTAITLQQARATAADVRNLRFVTKTGVRVLIDQAAGIVIALLGAFSLVALIAAAILLASQAAAEVQRRLAVIGVQRAIGVPRGRVALEQGLGAAVLALGAGGLGLALGALAVQGPSAGLLHALNEREPGWTVLTPLLVTLALLVALATTAAAWPAWRAAGRRPVELLRGAELRLAGRRILPGSGPFALGARLGLARRGRALLAITVLAVSGAVVLLMLGLASLLAGLRDDPGSVGKRYGLTVRLPAEAAGDVRALPGVQDASPRYVVRGADSFSLGEPVKLIAMPGDHTRFEDPPLAEGRRLRTDGEAEVGTGLASALGVGVGGTLAVQLPSGGEARFRVVGTVRALDDDGRVAYVRPPRVLAADPGVSPEVVIRVERGSDRAEVTRGLRGLGAEPTTVGGATTRSGAFLGTLTSLLRVVAVLDALVCLFALVTTLGLIARERRPTLALLRSAGAPAGTITLVLAGAALALAVPAALAAIVLERVLLAPLVGRLAAGYAELAGGATAVQSLAVSAVFVLLALLASVRVSRSVCAQPPVVGLREDA